MSFFVFCYICANDIIKTLRKVLVLFSRGIINWKKIVQNIIS